MWKGVIEHYKKYLPVTKKTPLITLQEGDTPLIQAKRLSREINRKLDIYLKYEGANPTGSFKDRGMTLAISKAKEEGANAVICASTGNTSASAAAYSAAAEMDCFVLIPSGHIALGKLSQAIVHGAKVLSIDGNFDVALNMVREISAKHRITLVNSLNPFRIEGQKTGAFEIIEQLGKVPDFQAMPVGNAGNITAYWKGYREWKADGITKNLPKMLGFQAAGSAPIVEGHPIEHPETIATAIRIGNPASWKQAAAARDESGGLIDKVTDDEIIAAYRMVASLEGIFVEPASAASIAGLIKLSRAGYFKSPATVVCILTGHGLKDPDRAIASCEQPEKVPAEISGIIKAMHLK